MSAKESSGDADLELWFGGASLDPAGDPARFAQSVLGQAERTLELLGKTKSVRGPGRDLAAAKELIDELARVEGLVQGRLTHDDGELLHHTLTTLRMAYVEAAESQVRRQPRV